MKHKIISAIAIAALLYVGFAYATEEGLGFARGRGCQGNINNAQMMFQPVYQDLDANADGQVTEQEHALFREKRQATRPWLSC